MKLKELEEHLVPGIEPGQLLTWSDPKHLGDSIYVDNPVTRERRRFNPQFAGIQLQYGPHAGRLLCSGRGYSKGKPLGLFAYGHNYVICSDDHGEAWKPGDT